VDLAAMSFQWIFPGLTIREADPVHGAGTEFIVDESPAFFIDLS